MPATERAMVDRQGKKSVGGVAAQSRVHIFQTERLHVYSATIRRVLFNLAELGVKALDVEDEDLGELDQ